MKKFLFIAPHLSTGGMPQYLLWYVERLMEEAGVEAYIIEWSDLSPEYTVQKKKLKELIGERLISWRQDTGEEVKEDNLGFLLGVINPDVVHLTEFPEAFLSQKVIDRLYAESVDFQVFETTHDSGFSRTAKKTVPDKFVFVSQTHMDRFRSYGVDMELVPYEVEREARPDREKILKELGLNPDFKHVLNVGLFTPGKNQGELFDIARGLHGEKVEFHFVGNQAPNFGDYWKPLMEKLPGNCRIWGEREDVGRFYSCMDLLVFPSKSELMPLVPIEALSWDMPVLMRKLDIYGDRFDGEVEWLGGDVQESSKKVREMLGVEETPAKIKLVHMLTQPEKPREIASVGSLEPLGNLGIEYVQHVNELCTEYPGEDTPPLTRHAKKNPAYYGCWESFKRAIVEEFSSDYLLLCECDCVLEVSSEEFIEELSRACEIIERGEISCVSFGPDNWSTVLQNDLAYGYREVDRFMGFQCVLISSRIRDRLIHDLETIKWDVADLWFDSFREQNHVSIAMPKEMLASQAAGYSLLDNKDYGKNKSEKSTTIKIGSQDFEVFIDKDFSLGFCEEIFASEVYSSKTCLVSPGDVCVDIGANLGLFSLYALSKGAGSVVSVECTNGTVLRVLHKNLDRFSDRVTIVNKAIHSTNEEVDFYKYADIGMSTTNVDILPRYGNVKEQLKVEGVTLERFCKESGLEKIDFLKIDVEGSEYEILLNTDKEFFSSRVSKIALEYHPLPEYSKSELKSYLVDCGFDMWEGDTTAEFGMMYGVNKDLLLPHKIKLVHTLCLPNTPREIRSVKSLASLADYGIEYIQHTNPPTKTFPTELETVMPFTSERKIPGHYGCYTSFKRAFLEGFTNNVEFFLFCEGDCLLDVSSEEFVKELVRGCELIKDGKLDCITLGHLDWSEKKQVLSDGFSVVDQFMNAQCVLFGSSCRDVFREELLNGAWDVTDQWLKFYLVKHKLLQGMPGKQLTSQAVGMSLLESWVSPQRRRGEAFACKYEDVDGFARVSFKSDSPALNDIVLTVLLRELGTGRLLFKEEEKYKFLQQCWVQSGVISEYLQGVELVILNGQEEVFSFYKAFGELGEVVRLEDVRKFNGKVECEFIGPPKVSVSGEAGPYRVEFWKDSNLSFQVDVPTNHWGSVFTRYFCDWTIKVYDVSGNLFEYTLDLKKKKVYIEFGSKALGDTLAWFPYVEEFQLKHDCEVVVSTFWNSLFEKEYPRITFESPGTKIVGAFAYYTIGCWDDDGRRHKNNWRTVPLQKVATDILGLEYVEKKARITVPNLPSCHQKDYVAISEFGTVQSKFWNRVDGWPRLVNKIKTSLGLAVLAVSSEQTKLTKVRRCTGRSIETTINNLHHAKAFVGVGSGLSWLAWTLNVPTVMISGFSEKFTEMSPGENVSRIINEEVCHGCFNDLEYAFDRGDWNWCPRDSDFECSKQITEDVVFAGLVSVLE